MRRPIRSVCSHRPWKVCVHAAKAHFDVCTLYTRSQILHIEQGKSTKVPLKTKYGLDFCANGTRSTISSTKFDTATDKSHRLPSANESQSIECCTVETKERVSGWRNECVVDRMQRHKWERKCIRSRSILFMSLNRTQLYRNTHR